MFRNVSTRPNAWDRYTENVCDSSYLKSTDAIHPPTPALVTWRVKNNSLALRSGGERRDLIHGRSRVVIIDIVFHRLAAGTVLSLIPAALAFPALTPVAVPVLLLAGVLGVETADPHMEMTLLACL